MANRPTPAFLRRPRRQAEASGVFTRFKAEAARPEQQAIFKMMVKQQGALGSGSLLASTLAGARTAPVRVALVTTLLAGALVAGHDRLVGQSEDERGEVVVSEAELAPRGLVAISATTRGKEPEPGSVVAPASLTVEPVAAKAGPWPVSAAEAKPITATRQAPPAKPLAADPPEALAEPEADEEGAGGPYAVWLPEPKPGMSSLAAREELGADYRVNLAVVRYPESAAVIREDFTRKVPWDQPFEFVFEPFRGGSLKVLGVRGLDSQAEAERMCTRARKNGFECVLAEG